MTNALTEAEKSDRYYKRLSMKGFWDIRKDTEIMNIINSFLYDMRFYGAEWIDISEDFETVNKLINIKKQMDVKAILEASKKLLT